MFTCINNSMEYLTGEGKTLYYRNYVGIHKLLNNCKVVVAPGSHC